jgi:hypothetical protein
MAGNDVCYSVWNNKILSQVALLNQLNENYMRMLLGKESEWHLYNKQQEGM